MHGHSYSLHPSFWENKHSSSIRHHLGTISKEFGQRWLQKLSITFVLSLLGGPIIIAPIEALLTPFIEHLITHHVARVEDHILFGMALLYLGVVIVLIFIFVIQLIVFVTARLVVRRILFAVGVMLFFSARPLSVWRVWRTGG